MSDTPRRAGGRPGKVEAATRAHVKALGPSAEAHPLAQSAINLARRQDKAEKDSQAAQLAQQLRSNLDALAKLHPAASADDELDAIRRRRESA